MDYGTLPQDPISTATASALSHLKDVATAAATVACKECSCLPEVHASKTAAEYSTAVNHAADASLVELDSAYRAFVAALRGAVLKHGDDVAAKGDAAKKSESSGPKPVPTPVRPTEPTQAEQPRGPAPRR